MEAFRECFALETVDFASCTMRSDPGASGVNILGSMMFVGCYSLKTILNWPTNNFSIGESALCGCGCEELVLPPQVTEIGYRSFASCKKLLTVTFPKTLTKLGVQAFSECPELKNITFESQILRRILH